MQCIPPYPGSLSRLVRSPARIGWVARPLAQSACGSRGPPGPLACQAHPVQPLARSVQPVRPTPGPPSLPGSPVRPARQPARSARLLPSSPSWWPRPPGRSPVHICTIVRILFRPLFCHLSSMCWLGSQARGWRSGRRSSSNFVTVFTILHRDCLFF